MPRSTLLLLSLITLACTTRHPDYIKRTPIEDPTGCNNESYELVNDKDLYISTREDTVWTDSLTDRKLSVGFSRFDGESNTTYSNGTKIYWRFQFEDNTDFQTIIRKETPFNLYFANNEMVTLSFQHDSDLARYTGNIQHFFFTYLTDSTIKQLSRSPLTKIELELEYKNLTLNFENSNFIIKGLTCIQKI